MTYKLVHNCLHHVYNVSAQDVDEDWPIEMYDHDGVAHNITLSPGEMVLWESHSILHGRPFAMKGKVRKIIIKTSYVYNKS